LTFTGSLTPQQRQARRLIVPVVFVTDEPCIATAGAAVKE
jgi:hypothetical protein